MFAVRSMLTAIAGALLLASIAGWPAHAQNKDRDPKSYGGWIAEVERPAASKLKTPKAKVGRGPIKAPKSK
jgi:hypothetical protein